MPNGSVLISGMSTKEKPNSRSTVCETYVKWNLAIKLCYYELLTIYCRISTIFQLYLSKFRECSTDIHPTIGFVVLVQAKLARHPFQPTIKPFKGLLRVRSGICATCAIHCHFSTSSLYIFLLSSEHDGVAKETRISANR